MPENFVNKLKSDDNEKIKKSLGLKIDTKLMEIPVSIFSLKIPIVMSLIA